MNLDETGQDESKDKEKNAPNKEFPLKLEIGYGINII